MRLFTKLSLVTLLVTCSYCAFAKPVVNNTTDTTVSCQLSGFNKIKIGGPFEVHLTQGQSESVRFEAPTELAGHIVTEVNNGVLRIRRKHENWGWGVKSWYGDKGIWHNRKKIVVYVTARDLNEIAVSGSGNVTFNDGLAATDLKLKVRGSGEIVGKIDVKTLESRISGSGHIQLTGNAERSAVRIAGSGRFTARNLVTTNSAAHVSGSGSAQINAVAEVDAAVRGSGNISYTGAAKIVKSSKSGSGEINRY